MIDFVAKNFLQIIGSGGSVLLGIGLIVTGADVDGRTQQMKLRQIEQNKVDTWLAEEAVEIKSAKAEQRYQSGCVIVNQQIVAGMKVARIEPGEAVCDRVGITGVVDGDGYITDIARTSDDLVIEGRLSRR